jgi:predicted aconitase with swiveling domain
MLELQGTVVIGGEARGRLLATSEPLSFWGGYDQQTGEIIDRRHPLSGMNGTNTILSIPFTRGSSTTTAILLEAIRAGVAPAALITTAVDTFLTLASVVADEMYRAPIPIIVLSTASYARLLSAFGDGSIPLTIDIKKNGVVTSV